MQDPICTMSAHELADSRKIEFRQCVQVVANDPVVIDNQETGRPPG